MKWIDKKISASARDIKKMRQFGLMMSWAFPGFLCLLPWVLGFKFSLLPIAIGAAFLVVAYARPLALAFIYIPWMAAAGVLGQINQRILLFLFFFLVVTPVAYFMRMIGRDTMARALSKSDPSYRVVREIKPAASQMERPF